MTRAERRVGVAAAARLLGVSMGTVRNWIRAGKIPATRQAETPGGKGVFQIRLGDLDALKKNTTTQKERNDPAQLGPDSSIL